MKAARCILPNTYDDETLCFDCALPVYNFDFPAPSLDDDEAWQVAATSHHPTCTWIRTRAFRVEYPSDSLKAKLERLAALTVQAAEGRIGLNPDALAYANEFMRLLEAGDA